MKTLKNIFCIALCGINTQSTTMDENNTLMKSLLHVTPTTIDDLYYSIIFHPEKNQILDQFYNQTKWDMLPLRLKKTLLKDKDKALSLNIFSLSNCNVRKKNMTQSLPIVTRGKITKSKPEENSLYIPYIQTVTPGSSNSKFALKICNIKKKSYIIIGTYMGKVLGNLCLRNLYVLQGAFCSNDNNLVLLTQQQYHTYMETYTCGYTPEQMLCILAYHNAKKDVKQLHILARTIFFNSLLLKKCPLALKILFKIANILEQKA